MIYCQPVAVALDVFVYSYFEWTLTRAAGEENGTVSF
jgi:hypothetical protein